MNPVAKLLIVSGATLIVAGLIWQFGGKFLTGIPLGRLPGDLSVERPGFRFYFPITTSILLSLILTAILYLFRKL